MAIRSDPHKPGPKKARRIEVPSGMPKMPRGYLNATGRRWFNEVGQEAARKGIISPMDAAGLALAAAHYSIALMAAKEMSEGVTEIDERKLPRKSPASQILRDHSASFRGWIKELGISPVARSQLVPAGEAPLDDLTAALFASIAEDLDDG